MLPVCPFRVDFNLPYLVGSLFGRPFFHNLGVGPGCSLLAGLALGMIPLLYVRSHVLLFLFDFTAGQLLTIFCGGVIVNHTIRRTVARTLQIRYCIDC